MRFSKRAIGAGLVVAVLAGPVRAQTADDEVGANEIVVTATKQGASSIQNVPLSIQALTGEDLAERGAIDFNDYARLIPGLSAQDTGPGDKRYIIRGITSSGPGTVGVYLDEAIITGENAQDGGGQQTDIKLFDIERVEVLKGPQGTTFGSSSLGGTIRYIINKPLLDEDSARASGELRATKGADAGFQTEGMINVAVVPGTFAVRVAGLYVDLPGYIDSQFGEGVDGERTKAVRGSAQLVLGDFTFNMMALYQKTNQDSKNYFNLVDYFKNPAPRPYYQTQITQTPFTDKNQIYSGSLDYSLDFGTLTAAASRYVRDLNYVRDASPFADRLLGRPYYTTGRSAITQPKHRRVDSYELRFASQFGGPLEVLVGLFGSDEHRFFRSRWLTVNADGEIDPTFPATLLLDRTVDSSVRERAIFGQAVYEIVPNLKFTAGGRYYDFRLKELTSVLVRTGGAPGTGPGLPSSDSVNGFIPRFNLAYTVDNDLNAYVQVAKGFRAGGNNDQTAAAIVNVTIPPGFEPDSLWNYEVGVKAKIAPGLYANVAAYYVDWSNIQVKLLATRPEVTGAGFPYTGNAGGADVKGFEATLDGRPLQGLSIALSVNYNQAELNKTNAPPATGNKGDRLPYVPRWAFAAVADYEDPIGSTGLKGTVGGDVTYVGARATDFNRSLLSYRYLPSNILVALRAGIKGEGWSAMMIANNLFNDQHIINYTSLGFGSAPDELYVNRPRTIALRFATDF